jgi:hypothetical protein
MNSFRGLKVRKIWSFERSCCSSSSMVTISKCNFKGDLISLFEILVIFGLFGGDDQVASLLDTKGRILILLTTYRSCLLATSWSLEDVEPNLILEMSITHIETHMHCKCVLVSWISNFMCFKEYDIEDVPNIYEPYTNLISNSQARIKNGWNDFISTLCIFEEN